ncbi:MAG: thioesterase family protein [Pirellulaceae bacterium]
MKVKPKVGDAGQVRFTVADEHTITIADDPQLAVLSTPSLIWFLEHAARDALAPLLEAGETSVGTQVDVEHLAATPIGHAIACIAKVIHVEGAAVTFQVSASDQREVIARGVHKRRVVRCQRFNEYVRKKLL